jgi:hypothetical protein
MTRSELFKTIEGADPIEIKTENRDILQGLWYEELRCTLRALEKALKKILRTPGCDPDKSAADLKDICTKLEDGLKGPGADDIFDIVNKIGELSLVSSRVEAVPADKKEEKKFVAEVTIKENSTGATYSLSRILTINPSKLSKELIPSDQAESIAASWTFQDSMKDLTPSVNTLSMTGKSDPVDTQSHKSGPVSIGTIDSRDR